MTSMLHRFADADPLQERLQRAQLHQVVRSRALQTALAESYVGWPLKTGAPSPDISRHETPKASTRPYPRRRA
jgi:hypothetical protein